MKVNIEIEKLVLNGFDYHDHKRISMALEQELVRLIRDNGLPEGFAQGAEIPQIDAASCIAPAGMSPRWIGAKVAKSIYRAWKAHLNTTVSKKERST